MDLCSRCRRRKAKRRCPALGASLCNLCCGQARGKDIHCPDDCPFLAEHKPYQERRSVERGEAGPSRRSGPDILQDERLAWLASHIEFPLSVYGRGRPELTDAEAIQALEYARDRLETSRHLLVVPGEALRPRNELGEAVLESMDKCRFEGRLILPGTDSAYSLDERRRVLERVLEAAREMARSDPQGRNFLDRLIEHFAQASEPPGSAPQKP
jgi:hypothetical protein